MNTGFDYNLDLEHPEEMNPEIAKALLQWVKGSIDSSTKTAEALDMLEKGQIKVRTDFGIEDKAVSVISRLTGYAIRALMIIALFIGSCLLCTVSAAAGEGTVFTTALPIVGIVGYVVSVFFAYRLYKDMKKGK